MATTFEHDTATPALLVHLHPAFELTDEQFEELCRLNRDLRIEMTAAFASKTLIWIRRGCL